MDKITHTYYLITVYDKIYHRLVTVGISALGFKLCHTAAEGGGQLLAYPFGLFGNDDGALGSVDTLYDKVYRLKCRGVGNDGIEGKYPALEHKAADDIQKHVVRHNEGAYRDTQSLCEYYRHDLDTVHSSAVSDGKTASYARYYTAEQSAEQKVCSRKGRCNADVYGQNVGYKPGGERIYGNGIDCVEGKKLTLLFETEEEQGDVQYKQKKGEGQMLGGELLKEHRRSRYAAVVELDGGQKDCYTEGVYYTRRGEHKQIKYAYFFEIFYQYLFLTWNCFSVFYGSGALWQSR